MPLTKQEIWQRQWRKRKQDPAYKEKDRLRAKKKRDAPLDDAAKKRRREQTKLRTRKWRERKNAQPTNTSSKDNSSSSTSTGRSRHERWINRNVNEMSIEPNNPDINVRFTSSTPNTSFQNSDFNNSLQSIELPVTDQVTFLRPNLPAIKKSVNRYKRELSNSRKKYKEKSEESTVQQRTIWKLQKRLKTLESENNQEESVESSTSSNQNVDNILKEEGLNPSQYPKLVKELLVNDVLVTSFNSQTTIDKKTVSEKKIGRYLSTRLSIDRRHWIRKRKTISARQLLSNETKTKIISFLTRPDNSTCLPGKKDALKIKIKVKAQVYILSDYLKNLFNKYIMENPRSACKFSTFCKARPRYVRIAKYNSRTTCLCTHHQNLHLKLKALAPRFSDRPDTFIKDNTDAEINEKLNNLQESVSYEEWRRVETHLPNGKLRYNTRLVKVEVPVEQFKESFKIQVGKFREHAYRVTTQYSEVKRLKENLKENEGTLQMDFAQNYTCGHTEEIQSAYFAKEQVTLHPMVLHFKEGGELKHKSFVAVTDERTHNSFSVFAFMKTIIPRIKEICPTINKMHYLTDSPTSQYRNTKIMNLISRHETIFGMKASWTYFESGHGKGPCDGVGGTLKRLADDASKMGSATIIDAESFFDWSQSLETMMDIYWVSKAEIDEAKLQIESWTLTAVPECMKLHAVVVRNEGIFTRRTSCFKYECCNQDDIPPICDGWVCTSVLQSQPQPKPAQPQPQQQSKPAQPQSQLQSKPQPVSIHYEIDEYIAVRYNADWFIGQILEVKADEMKVIFMERAGSLMAYTFFWPSRKDILWVSQMDVIVKVLEPEECGSRRRPTMKLSESDLKTVLDKFIN